MPFLIEYSIVSSHRLLLSWGCLFTNSMGMNLEKCLVMKNIPMDFIQWLVFPFLLHPRSISLPNVCSFSNNLWLFLTLKFQHLRYNKRVVFCSSRHYFGGFALWLLYCNNMWPKNQWTPLPCSCQTRIDKGQLCNTNKCFQIFWLKRIEGTKLFTLFFTFLNDRNMW